MLDAANIVPFTAPAAPSVPTLQAFTNSTITLTWTPGAGSDGSVVVMRARQNCQRLASEWCDLYRKQHVRTG